MNKIGEIPAGRDDEDSRFFERRSEPLGNHTDNGVNLLRAWHTEHSSHRETSKAPNQSDENWCHLRHEGPESIDYILDKSCPPVLYNFWDFDEKLSAVLDQREEYEGNGGELESCSMG